MIGYEKKISLGLKKTIILDIIDVQLTYMKSASVNCHWTNDQWCLPSTHSYVAFQWSCSVESFMEEGCSIEGFGVRMTLVS